MKINTKSKGIALLLIVGLIRAVLLPDFGYGAFSFLIIPFIFPLLLVWLSAVLVFKKILTRFEAVLWGFASIVLSDIIGLIFYGSTAGWGYITHDSESQGIFILTFFTQSLIYLVGFSVFVIVLKYNARNSSN